MFLRSQGTKMSTEQTLYNVLFARYRSGVNKLLSIGNLCTGVKLSKCSDFNENGLKCIHRRYGKLFFL